MNDPKESPSQDQTMKDATVATKELKADLDKLHFLQVQSAMLLDRLVMMGADIYETDR